MSSSSAEPAGDSTFPALCAHTHLFPGARCRVQELPDAQRFAAAPLPVGLALRFSDGVIADAEVLVADAGEAVLSVASYTTGAGTRIAERVWPVRTLRRAGEEVEVTVGSRTDWESAGR